MPPKKDTLAEAKARAQEQVKQRAAASAASKLAKRPASPAPKPSPAPALAAAAAGKRKRAEAVPVVQNVDARKKPREGVAAAETNIQPRAPSSSAAPGPVPVVVPSDSEGGESGEEDEDTDDDDDPDLHRIAPRAPRASPPPLRPAAPSSQQRPPPAQRRAPSPAGLPPQLPAASKHPLAAGGGLRGLQSPSSPAPSAVYARAAPLISAPVPVPTREPGGGTWAPPPGSPLNPQFGGLSQLGSGAPSSDRRRRGASAVGEDAPLPRPATPACCQRPAALAALSWPVTVALTSLGLTVVLLGAWAVSSTLLASTPGAVATAVVREMRLAAGEVACFSGGGGGGDGRSLLIPAVLERLRAVGASAAAASLSHAAEGVLDPATHDRLSAMGVTLAKDATLSLDAAIPVLKPWACWAEEEVLAPAAAAVWAGTVWGASTAWAGTVWGASNLVAAALARPDVALAVLAVLAVALWRWNVRARDLVVAAMFDCALRELEALAGRAVPLAQLRPHVLDRLYAGPYSVMALRAARYWPRVEARLKGDSRVLVDAAAETAAGLVQPCATWVSPLRRAPPGAGGASPAPRGGLQPLVQPVPWQSPPPVASPAPAVRR